MAKMVFVKTLHFHSPLLLTPSISIHACQTRHMDEDTVSNTHNCTGGCAGRKQLSSREQAGDKK